jgi:hypothetical protein
LLIKICESESWSGFDSLLSFPKIVAKLGIPEGEELEMAEFLESSLPALESELLREYPAYYNPPERGHVLHIYDNQSADIAS